MWYNLYINMCSTKGGIMNTKNTWKAGIYIRLSKADEGKNESESITNQRNFIISYLQENGYELYDEYIDDVIKFFEKLMEADK